MHKLAVACVAALFASACAADDEPAEADVLPAMAVRALGLSPANTYVTTFTARQLRALPTEPVELTEEIDVFDWIAQRTWAARAAVLGLDPRADASMVAYSAAIGSCGVTHDFLLAAPSTTPDLLATRVEAAIAQWRYEHPTSVDDDTAAPADPAVSRWVAVHDGVCTILQITDFDQIGVTLTRDGLLIVHGTAFGRACA